MRENWDYAELGYDFLCDEPYFTTAYRENVKNRDALIELVEETLFDAGGGSCFVEYFDELDRPVYRENVEV